MPQAVAAGRSDPSKAVRRAAGAALGRIRQSPSPRDRSSNAGRRDVSMGFDAESLGLSDSALGLLRDLVHERTGVVLRRQTARTSGGFGWRVW
jgi:hypothetical protein